MQSWEQYYRSQEEAAFGNFLVDVIAKLYGVESKVEAVKRAVYKSTDCGAWIEFDEYGIEVGTIVEGSDAEFSTRVDVTDLDCDEDDAKTLTERFRSAIAECETFAARVRNGG